MKNAMVGLMVLAASMAIAIDASAIGCNGSRVRSAVSSVVSRVPVLRVRSTSVTVESNSQTIVQSQPVRSGACECVSGAPCKCEGGCNCSPQSSIQSAVRSDQTLCEGGVCRLVPSSTSVDVFHHGPISSAVRSVAQMRADLAASRGLKGMAAHVGQVNGYYEGVGFDSSSSDAAVRRCCYWGQRTPFSIGVARGSDGWYACVHYH